jgi:hypothetical protein
MSSGKENEFAKVQKELQYQRKKNVSIQNQLNKKGS